MRFYRRKIKQKTYPIWHFHPDCQDNPHLTAGHYYIDDTPPPQFICLTCQRLYKSQDLRKSLTERAFSRGETPPDILDLAEPD